MPIDPSLQGREREGGPITPEEMNELFKALQIHNELQRQRTMNESPQTMTPQQWFSRDESQIQQIDTKSGSPRGEIATPKTKEEFDALPDGTFYIEPDDDHVYQKGNKTRPLPRPTPRGVLAGTPNRVLQPGSYSSPIIQSEKEYPYDPDLARLQQFTRGTNPDYVA